MKPRKIHEEEKVEVTILNVSNSFPDELDSCEKDVEFMLNGNVYLAFYDGNDLFPGKNIKVTISFLDSSNEDSIENVYGGNPNCGKYLQHDDHWSYFAFGQIKSVNPTLVDFGDFELEIGLNADKDKIGRFIFWHLGRMNIWPV